MLVCGVSGSGKTTFARDLADRFGLPFHEVDELFHSRDRRPSRLSVAEDVGHIVEQDEWVFDSHGYSQVRDLLWSRSDGVVWLDFSRPVVLRRVIRRSATRAGRRQPIVNGNVETFGDRIDPEHLIRWSMSNYAARELTWSVDIPTLTAPGSTRSASDVRQRHGGGSTASTAIRLAGVNEVARRPRHMVIVPKWGVQVQG